LRFAMGAIAIRQFSLRGRAATIRSVIPGTDFWPALAAIVVIDLVLAGDNAIVIALAARGLPKVLQRRAIAWGSVGAVVLRSALTVSVLWLLQIPGLMLAGGALLVWIAYRLLTGDEASRQHEVRPAMSFWSAMRTIVVADAVMGLDNVLAVGGAAAGAAQNSVLLVVLGLLISIPIVVWGSVLILRWIERFPILLYVGGGVLAWTAVKMMTGEPLVQDFLAGRPLVTGLIYAGIVGGLPAFCWLRNRRLEPEKALKETLQ
jgi:YjbE family integral membrane protein